MPVNSGVWQIVHVHPAAPSKPALGAPCNGCGVCCLAEPCPVGVLLSRRRTGACAALRWSEPEARYRCGAVREPASVLPPMLQSGGADDLERTMKACRQNWTKLVREMEAQRR